MSFDNLPDIDVLSFLRTAGILLLIGMLYSLWRGVGLIREASQVKFYRLRRAQLVLGWRMLLVGLTLGGLGLLVRQYGEPVAYQLVDITPTSLPSASPTLEPTLTVSPTITTTPTITLTPAESYTPTPSPTPHVPLAVEAQFEGIVTPPPGAVFSPLSFSRGIDDDFNLIRPGEIFQNPISQIYGSFSYAQMANGVQWTALWYRDGELIYFETNPWEGGTGGLGFTEWTPDPDDWLPGTYTIQIFVGNEPKQAGSFVVQDNPPTKTPTATMTPLPSLTPTITPTLTRWPTLTSTPPSPTITPQPTLTRTIMPTWAPTLTPTATLTRWPTATNTPKP